MRKTLQAVAVLALVFTWAETLLALYGPHRLPVRIPVHFDAAGHVNGWGTPVVLWFMPAIATVVYGLMAWVTRHPSAFNYPVRVTPSTRPCLETLTCTLIAWLQAEVVCLLAWIQWATIASARHGVNMLPPWAILIGILAVWGTIAIYVVTMVRKARGPRRA